MHRLKMLAIFCLALVLTISIHPVWGADYGTYTTEELAAIRGTLKNATDEERAAFTKEWQKRVQNMTAEERQKYSGPPDNAPADGTGYRTNAPSGGYGKNHQSGVGRGGYGAGGGMRNGGGRGRN